MKPLTILLLAGFPFPALAAPEKYVIDPAHTFPRFEYSHFGYSTQSHRFEKAEGSIVLDREARAGSVEVVIDANSINAGSARFNEHIRSGDFFDVEKYPSITFKSSELQFDGDKLTTVTGNLTLKGVTRALALTVTSFHCMPHPIRQKDACGANATAKLKRSDFNLGKYVPNVSDEVTLVISVEAVKE